MPAARGCRSKWHAEMVSRARCGRSFVAPNRWLWVDGALKLRPTLGALKLRPTRGRSGFIDEELRAPGANGVSVTFRANEQFVSRKSYTDPIYSRKNC